HVVIAERPGVTCLPENAELKTVLDKHAVMDASVLHTTESGRIFRVQIPWLDISATRIRDMLRMGHNTSFLLPEAVIDYIRTHGLYAGT
ncbi:MAG: nicotinate-nicotinamide nucleotide adenylyltransferase, partial [Gammaproteobacteria bacterium]